MGSEATLEPVPGGVYRIRMPDGFAAAGEFLQVTRPRRVIFTWGFADDEAAQRTKHQQGETPSASAMPPGSTRVRNRSGHRGPRTVTRINSWRTLLRRNSRPVSTPASSALSALGRLSVIACAASGA